MERKCDRTQLASYFKELFIRKGMEDESFD